MRITEGTDDVSRLDFVFLLFPPISIHREKYRKMLITENVDKNSIKLQQSLTVLKSNSLLKMLEQETLWANNLQIIFTP